MNTYYRIRIYGQLTTTSSGGFETMLDAYEHLATLDCAFSEDVRSVVIERYLA